MNERIKQLTISKGIYDSLCDPYDKHGTGDYYSSVMDDLQRFAELIINECADLIDNVLEQGSPPNPSLGKLLQKHFGVNDGSV